MLKAKNICDHPTLEGNFKSNISTFFFCLTSICCFTSLGVFQLFKTRALFSVQTKLAPPLMKPTELKPYHIKNLTALNRTKIHVSIFG